MVIEARLVRASFFGGVDTMTIKVKATRMGFYENQRRYADSEFEIKSEKDLGSWMERVTPLPTADTVDLDEVVSDGADEKSEHQLCADEAAILVSLADTMEEKASKARAALKSNSKRELREQVEAMEQQAKEARATADEASSQLDQEVDL